MMNLALIYKRHANMEEAPITSERENINGRGFFGLTAARREEKSQYLTVKYGKYDWADAIKTVFR